MILQNKLENIQPDVTIGLKSTQHVHDFFNVTTLCLDLTCKHQKNSFKRKNSRLSQKVKSTMVLNFCYAKFPEYNKFVEPT